MLKARSHHIELRVSSADHCAPVKCSSYCPYHSRSLLNHLNQWTARCVSALLTIPFLQCIMSIMILVESLLDALDRSLAT